VTTWGKTEDFTLGDPTTELEDPTRIELEDVTTKIKNMVREAMAHRLNSVGVNKVIQSVIMPTALFVFTHTQIARSEQWDRRRQRSASWRGTSGN
jgi:hypothetical protein